MNIWLPILISVAAIVISILALGPKPIKTIRSFYIYKRIEKVTKRELVVQARFKVLFEEINKYFETQNLVIEKQKTQIREAQRLNREGKNDPESLQKITTVLNMAHSPFNTVESAIIDKKIEEFNGLADEITKIHETKKALYEKLV